MDKPQKSKENRIPLRGWLVPGKDDDLINAWQAISDGEKSRVLRDAFEAYINLPASKRRNPLSRALDDISRILKMLEELLLLVKDIRSRPFSGPAQGAGTTEPPPQIDPELERAAKERTKTMAKNLW